MGKVTFSTGITVGVRRVPVMTIRAVEASMAKPQPPMQKTDLGEEPNYAHPDYAAALSAYTVKLADATLDALILFGVDVDLESAEVKAELQRARNLAQRAHITLPDDDLLCYVKHVAAAGIEDIHLLRDALMSESMPSERRITEKMEALKSPVQGAGHPEVEGAE